MDTVLTEIMRKSVTPEPNRREAHLQRIGRILQGALDYVHRGWTQGASAREEDGDATWCMHRFSARWSATGALDRAIHEEMDISVWADPEADPYYQIFQGVYWYFYLAAGLGTARLYDVRRMWKEIQEWNDVKGRTLEDIENTFQRAIEIIVAEVQGADIQTFFSAAWLPEAIRSLQGCIKEASEEGFDIPNDNTLTLAEEFLKILATRIQQPPDIQPLQDASIAIDFRKFRNPVVEGGVTFTIEPDGAQVCYYRTRNFSDRTRISNVSDVKDILNASGWHALEQVGIE